MIEINENHPHLLKIKNKFLICSYYAFYKSI